MPICTVRQKVELIQQRQHANATFQAKLVEWETKMLGGLLTGLAQTQEAAKAMAKSIDKASLDLDGEESSKKIDTRTIEEIMEEGALIDDSRLMNFEDMEARLTAPARRG